MILPFLVLASYGLFDGRLLGYHHYRQAHDALIARTFSTTTLNPLQPAIDGITWGKALYVNDFPLYPWLVGMVWRVTGESLPVARLLSLAAGVGALLVFRRLMLRLTEDPRLADLSALLLGVMPVCAWFLRTVQRQSLFVLLLVVALERAVAWIDEQDGGALRAAIAAFAGALLLNPFAVYAVLPVADRLARRHGAGALLRPAPLLGGVVALLPAVVWYSYVVRVAPTLPTAAMVALTAPVAHRNFLDPARYVVWLSPAAVQTFLWTTAQFVLPAATSLAVAAAGFATTWREERWRFTRIWLLSVLVYFYFDYYPIAGMVHQYYYLNLALPAAPFLGAGFLLLHHRSRAGGRRWVFRLAAALFVLGALVYTGRLVRNDWHAEYYPIAERLARSVPRGARVQVVAMSDDPLFSYVLDPAVHHRLQAYSPAALERLLRQRDFDYLALVHEYEIPVPWPVLHRIRASQLEEVAMDKGLYVYRMAGRPGLKSM
ncbi:MAG TPA: glycosyltransferase family 39 protein [Candidatus Polarisedimenticolaceae bacterium]|nr:glycosyltransferase family 39 protein [Candidatus Polarisedimenticolaceae bacterium]